MKALRYLKALADETRLRLALVLFHYELSVNELVALLGMGQSRISRHLKILTEALMSMSPATRTVCPTWVLTMLRPTLC